MPRSIELLTHFRCSACGRWWSIADGELSRTHYCPWCGVQEVEKDKYSMTSPAPAPEQSLIRRAEEAEAQALRLHTEANELYTKAEVLDGIRKGQVEVIDELSDKLKRIEALLGDAYMMHINEPIQPCMCGVCKLIRLIWKVK